MDIRTNGAGPGRRAVVLVLEQAAQATGVPRTAEPEDHGVDMLNMVVSRRFRARREDREDR